MENCNQTSVSRFTLLGLSSVPRLQIVFFFVFLLMYMVTLSGNLLVIIVVRLNSRLQTPMYFFLSNLSVTDICFSTTIVPKMLSNSISQDKTISMLGCAAQMYFHLALGATECLILAVMAYDRYSAICKPLKYTTIMNPKLCFCLAAGCWVVSFLNSVIHAVFTFQLPYCKSSEVNHFFCEMPPLFRLSCRDTWFNEVAVYISGGLIALCSFLLTLLSYIHILSTIFKIRCTSGRYKSFSTCASHITVVTLYYGTIIFMYLRPHSSYFPDRDRVVSILYTVVTPMLNPIIYSIRNKDIIGVIGKTKHVMLLCSNSWSAGHNAGNGLAEVLKLKTMSRNVLENSNQTIVRHFILLGLSNLLSLQIFFFLLFSLMYMLILCGNLLLIFMVRLHSRLQTPMYFFLINLSFIDISFSSCVVPEMLANTISKDRSISFWGCATQMYFHLALGATECLILAVMAYDRYTAICKPLLYTTIMNRKVCLRLSATCWVISFFNSLTLTLLTFHLPFCKSNHINHFFCEMPPLLRLSCSYIWINELAEYISGVLIALGSCLLIFGSYFCIALTILKIKSIKEKQKVFSTCASHILVVSLYYGTVMFMHLRPRSSYSEEQDRIVSILYTVIIPMLNPIIYSMQNKDIKISIKKTFCDKIYH
ncbi:uncharacterized protein ACMZJ9_019861 [Mantella aurantiaca]